MIYLYDAVTGDFRQAADVSLLRDRMGDEILPPGATREAPPPAASGTWPRWSGHSWTLVPDHRGEVWYAPEGRPVPVHQLGDPAADGLMPSPPPEMLARARDAACAAIDAAAEAARLGAITPGVGQAMEYARAYDQARAVLAAEAPRAADYPLVARGTASTADLVAEAEAIIRGAARSDAALAEIRARRLAAKDAVRAALTLSEIHAAAAVAWDDAGKL